MLVDIRDRPDSQATYVAEDNIILLDAVEVSTVTVVYNSLCTYVCCTYVQYVYIVMCEYKDLRTCVCVCVCVCLL